MKRSLAVGALLVPWAILAQAPSRPAASKAKAPAQPVRIGFIYSDGNMPATIQAFKSVLEERPDLRGRIEINFLTESVFEDVKTDALAKSDVLVLDTMNQQMLDRFNTERKVDLTADVRKRGKVLAVGEGLQDRSYYEKLGALWDDKARAFWANSGASNQLALLKYALSQAKATRCSRSSTASGCRSASRIRWASSERASTDASTIRTPAGRGRPSGRPLARAHRSTWRRAGTRSRRSTSSR